MTHYLTVNEMKALPLGARVCFPVGADAYPDFLFTDRLTGTVSLSDNEGVWVKIDQHKDELNEWDNQIQVWFWEQDVGELPSQRVEHLFSTENGTLDRFVEVWCKNRSIEIDGDVFGLMFSGSTEVTETEAEGLIKEGIRLYPSHF